MTPTFIISLPRDVQRRAHLTGQLDALGMPYAVLDGVDGKSLPQAELDAAYDRRKAIALFNRELSRGEIGCALSHLSIYRKMVAEQIPHALVLEDDASILDDALPGILGRLGALYTEADAVAVLLNHVRRYDARKRVALDDECALYPAYRGVCAHGYFITLAAAASLARHLYPVHVVADKWEYFQERYLAVMALVPYPIGLTQACRTSRIDAIEARVEKLPHGSNPMYYLRKCVKQLRFIVASRPFIRIAHQAKHRRDLP